MLTRLLRWCIQVILVILVGFFGYHYFTREELHSCVSVPLGTLAGQTPALELDEAKVSEFMTRLTAQLGGVASRGGQLWSNLSSGEATAAVQTAVARTESGELLDTAQYLYCKAVVDKVEKR